MNFILNKGLKTIFAFFIIVFFIAYFVFPILFSYIIGDINYYSKLLSTITLFSSFFIFIGIFLHFKYRIEVVKLKLSYSKFSFYIFVIFICFIVLCLITAEKIPIVASIQGEDPARLAYLREMFLKARQGWQKSFVYLNALLGGALVPYIICVAFERKTPYRFIYLLIFFIYSISFLEKAFFLKIAIPLFILYFFNVKNKYLYIVASTIAIVLLLIVMSIAAGGSDEFIDSGNSFFSAFYSSRSPIEQVAWRAIVIPVVTSVDALRLFFENYNGDYLLGATNGTFSFLFDIKRVEFEKEVFSLQWGQNEVESGSANSVYLTEAFVNFGYIGVALFSFFVGRILFVFMQSKEMSLKAISVLFIYGIFNSGLLSTLLSNGYLLMLLFAIFISWED